uniref:non-specific serine/threonine protein kinase n=1 Tax=Stomoxys calcitrans TaxID=35570 RepID=A0A1I8PK04_STOCA
MDLGDPALKPIKVLGAGTFGRVFLCKYRNTQKVCVKRIIVLNPKAEMNMIMEEVYIMSQLRHPNIIQFIGSFVHAGTVNIIMDYAPNGTLNDLIFQARPKGLAHNDIMRYFCDTLMGLEYLHIRHVIHRDLKPANLLVDANGNLKIADFGISSVHGSRSCNAKALGTPYYTPPEVLRGERYDYKSDIWSLGCILYEMCLGHCPFSQAATLDELRYLIRVLTRQKMDCSNLRKTHQPLWANLCERMIVSKLQLRISLPEIICLEPTLTIAYYHKYFDYKY